MPRMSEADFSAHNDRVAQNRLAEREYRESLTVDKMVREMQENPSHEKFKVFNEVFNEYMGAQVTSFGADSVGEKWTEMEQAYRKFVTNEESRYLS